ncbi:hypothetical protein WJX74_010054 [Apatococcus lobatus]|uniref:Uncharacterized protein n=1 Tax=Apatococcus lobatus TaxID=904363 RepID=A0AAW1RX89_9CHLO
MSGNYSTVASSSVELEIEELVAETDGDGPTPGMFPRREDIPEVNRIIMFAVQAEEAHQQDKSDWQVLPRIFNALSQEFGPYHLDACADLAGTNGMVEPYWTVKDDCTTTEWGGLNVWCKPPFHMVGAVLENYLRCKKGSPTNTSATFVVPGWVGAA